MDSGQNRDFSDDWYQTIELKDGTVIKGKVDTRERIPFLK